jgi:hypothetical protein
LKNYIKQREAFKVTHYTDGCEEVWGIFEGNATRALAEFRFWDEGEGTERREMEERARLFGAAPAMLNALLLADKSLGLIAGPNYRKSEVRQLIRAAIRGATHCESPVQNTPSIPPEPVVPIKVATAIDKVVQHFLPDEKRDLDGATGVFPQGHIANELELLDEWLTRIAGTSLLG